MEYRRRRMLYFWILSSLGFVRRAWFDGYLDYIDFDLMWLGGGSAGSVMLSPERSLDYWLAS